MKRNTVHSIALLTLGLLVWSGSAQAQLEQSPIDIRPENARFSALPALDFHYSSSTSLHAVNTGSPDEHASIRADVPASAASLTLSGDTYDLLQFHFHTPGEHRLNGHEFPMEMHMVHRDSNGHLLVVGRWIEEGAANLTLDPIFSHLPELPTNTLDVSNFDLSALLPADLSSFRYDGSLTTPPFGEGVQWIVLNDPLEMSADQIHAFEHIFHEGNSREPQPLNGRIILTDVQGFAVPEPGSVAMLLSGGFVGAGFLLRRRKA